MIVTDPKYLKRNSEIVVDLAKQAMVNLSHYSNQNYEPAHFVEEFRTVRLHLPRQSGHTTAALQLMYEYPDSLLFVPDSSTREYTRSMLRNYTDDHAVRTRIDQNTFIPRSTILRNLRPVVNRPFLILDGASRMTTETKNEIIADFHAKIIVELQ